MMDEALLSKIAAEIKAAPRIAFLGGAGVSTASGIPDFRSPEGLYRIKSEYGVSYEEMLSASYFFSHTQDFYSFYWDKMVYPSAKPNLAHISLAKIGKKKRLPIITQNIDGLHQKAGSSIVYELHGTTASYHCLDCGKKLTLEQIEHHGVPHCPDCGGLVKPDVTLYGETLDEDTLLSAGNEIAYCSFLIIGGTSMKVYPASGLPDCMLSGKKLIINLEPTPYDERCDYVLHEDLGKALLRIEELL